MGGKWCYSIKHKERHFITLKYLLFVLYLFQKTVIFQFDSFWNTSHHFFQSKPIHFFQKTTLWNCKKKIPFMRFEEHSFVLKEIICTVLRNSSGTNMMSIKFLYYYKPQQMEKNKDSSCTSWNTCKCIYLNGTPVQCWTESIKTSPRRKWESQSEL